MSTINRMDQTFRRLIKDAGGEPDGSEEFFFNALPSEGLPEDGQITRSVYGVKRTSSAVRGSAMITAYRLSFRQMFERMPEPTIYLYNPQSSDEVIEALINHYGLGLDVSHFDPIPVSRPPFRVPINLKSTLYTASDVSGSGIDGRIYLNVKPANADLGELIKNNVMSKPTMPYEHRLGYTNAELLTYGVDFTPSFEEDYLELLKVSKTDDINGTEEPSVWTANSVIRLLKERLGIEVTRGLGREFELSLYGAQFLYNGPAQGYASADVRYDNVLVFKTLTDPAVDEAVYTYRGTLYLHYNNVI